MEAPWGAFAPGTAHRPAKISIMISTTRLRPRRAVSTTSCMPPHVNPHYRKFNTLSLAGAKCQWASKQDNSSALLNMRAVGLQPRDMAGVLLVGHVRVLIRCVGEERECPGFH